MNTLGQLKALIELQSLKSFTDPQNTQTTSTVSSFAHLLQELVQTQTMDGELGQQSSQVNTLGFINSQLPFLPVNIKGNQPVSEISEAESMSSMNTSTQASSSLESIIGRAAKKYRLPAKLIKSIIRHESNFNPQAVSQAGASGLMQLMPSTARGLGVTDILDPEQNVMGGAKYIRNMLDKYNGNLKLALAAYNAGPGNVDKYGGIPPFKETQNYVQKVTSTYFT